MDSSQATSNDGPSGASQCKARDGYDLLPDELRRLRASGVRTVSIDLGRNPIIYVLSQAKELRPTTD